LGLSILSYFFKPGDTFAFVFSPKDCLLYEDLLLIFDSPLFDYFDAKEPPEFFETLD